MKLKKYFLIGSVLVVTALAAVVFQTRRAVADEVVAPPATRAGNFLGEEFELSDDEWIEDFPEDNQEGSPSRPGKVAICHKGITILVTQKAVAMHLAHGDTLGPCSPADTAYTIVCQNGQPVVVTLIEAAGHLKRGATLGMCDGGTAIIMCNGKANVAVPEAQVATRLKEGWTAGPCKGKEATVMCQNGRTVVVPQENVADRLKAGGTMGPCPKQ